MLLDKYSLWAFSDCDFLCLLVSAVVCLLTLFIPFNNGTIERRHSTESLTSMLKYL